MKKILLIACGSVAIKKVPALIELLKEKYEIKIIGSDAAKQQGRAFDIPFINNPYHIDLARWADLIVVVPATANTLAKIASGIADNEVCATILAHSKPIVFVPAMNNVMYENIVKNGVIEKLSKLGHMFIGPVYGKLHDGTSGIGRMTEPQEIFEKINNLLLNENKKKAIVANGASRVYIDKIRYITNLSSGQMGRALANELRLQGFEAELIDISEYSNEQFIKLIKTKKFDYYFSPAAFADYDVNFFDGKLKRNQIKNLELKENKDALAEIYKEFPEVKFIIFKHGDILDEALNKFNKFLPEMLVWTKIGAMGNSNINGAIITKNQTTNFETTKIELAKMIARMVK